MSTAHSGQALPAAQAEAGAEAGDDHRGRFDLLGWSVPTFTAANLRPKRSRYVLIVPVINEGERIQRQLRETFEIGAAAEIDVVVVDGGSTDGSLEPDFLKSVDVRALLTKSGKGKLSAQLRCGYAWALCEGYEGVVTIDGNGKDEPADIRQFIDGLDRGWDYLQASRFVRGGKGVNTPLVRLLAIRLIHAPALSLSARQWLTDTTQGFRAYSAGYLRHPRVQPFRDVFMAYELLAYLSVRASQLGYRVKELPTTRSYPKNEKTPTKISGFKAYFTLIGVVLATLAGAYAPSGEPRRRAARDARAARR